MMEGSLYKVQNIMLHLTTNKLISDVQHGFRAKRSSGSITSSHTYMYDIVNAIDIRENVDANYFDSGPGCCWLKPGSSELISIDNAFFK
ncbi:hypothetical protein Pmani_019889 [Petrolisthes manimaculis]|uniref:Reverse transcriptase domain-containing protein n=1 Tax=Petrolisthes manimaculis TaxID=1843537 RepID=A0AAE1PGT4_9EUCA|nr:hypothetical protein Pmani_019889 [Petrolisthes manimaculis]